LSTNYAREYSRAHAYWFSIFRALLSPSINVTDGSPIFLGWPFSVVKLSIYHIAQLMRTIQKPQAGAPAMVYENVHPPLGPLKAVPTICMYGLRSSDSTNKSTALQKTSMSTIVNTQFILRVPLELIIKFCLEPDETSRLIHSFQPHCAYISEPLASDQQSNSVSLHIMPHYYNKNLK
jgi:hypothetical protein